MTCFPSWIISYLLKILLLHVRNLMPKKGLFSISLKNFRQNQKYVTKNSWCTYKIWAHEHVCFLHNLWPEKKWDWQANHKTARRVNNFMILLHYNKIRAQYRFFISNKYKYCGQFIEWLVIRQTILSIFRHIFLDFDI